MHGIKSLKPSKKIEVYNGSLDCRFVKFDIFDGSYKDMKKNSGQRTLNSEP